MATKTPQQVADKWSRNIAASTQAMIDGANAVRINPAEQAIAKKQKLLANFTDAVQSGRWERGLRTTTLESWKQAYLQKGVNRVSQGAEAAKPKMTAFLTVLLPYEDTIKAELASMPDNTLEDSIARMTAWTRRMAQFSKG